MIRRACLGLTCLGLACLLAAMAPARADGCDALAARLIRGTGASLAGRSEALVVFRAADAERMSLVCARPPQPAQMLFRSIYREPNRYYFVLIGLAARTLTGEPAEAVESLALRLHRDTLLTGSAQQGRAGAAALRCEPGDRLDGLTDGTLCTLEPAAGAVRARHRPTLRSRAGLPAIGGQG